jgi:hypothetical protein
VLINPDGQKNLVSLSAVKTLGQDLDLVIVQFSGTKQYPVAEINTSSALKADDTIHIGGFPLYRTKLQFTVGQSLAVVKKRLNGEWWLHDRLRCLNFIWNERLDLQAAKDILKNSKFRSSSLVEAINSSVKTINDFTDTQ